MSKVIYVHDNGREEVLREGNINKFDVLFRSDYFAWKLWSREDIAAEISDLGYEVTEEKIDEVINAGGKWNLLSDCTDDEWWSIEMFVRDVYEGKE